MIILVNYFMKLDSIIIGVLYNHFYNMKNRGRKVIPWFQTAAVLSFVIVVTCILLGLIFFEILNRGYFEIRIPEVVFLIFFILLVILFFILIKRFYFDTNKHLSYLEKLNSLPLPKQKKYKFWVLTSIVLLPFVFLFVLYIFDKR